jgi:hypothetical protein
MLAKAVLFVVAALFSFGQSADRVFQFTHTDSADGRKEIAGVIGAMAEIRDLTPDPQGTLTVHGSANQLGLAEWLFTELDQRPSSGAHQYRLTGDDMVRVFYLPHTPTVQDFQEVAVLVRNIGDIQRVFTYNAPRAVIVRGTAEQIALAEWLSNEMDQPHPGVAGHDYHLTGGGDDTVRVLYFTPRTAGVQEFQEVAVLVRTIADIRRVFTYNGPRAFVARGTPEQIALAQWLLNQFNQQTSTPATYQYLSGGIESVVRLTYLTRTESVEDFQKMAVEIRTKTNIRRVFTYNAPRALALRGTVDQIAMADRLVQELNK